jgi:hypothetical protein
VKRFLLISALLLCAFSLKAQDTKAPAFKFGVEWGENTLLWYAYHFNYTTDIGSRVDQQDSRFKAAFNGSVMGFAGVNASDWLSVAFYGGFAGYDKGLRMIPALVRTTWYPRGACSDGIMAFMDLGTDVKTIIQENTVIADLGTGYRFSLSRHINLDFLLSLRTVQKRPPIPNPDGEGTIPAENVRNNSAGYYAIGLSIALEF